MMKIFVVTHKAYKRIAPKPLYDFLLVGSNNNKGKKDYYHDNGFSDNIADLNGSFCELTGMYWMWKNFTTDVIGLAHYRRFFVTEDKNLLTEKDIQEILGDYDIILSEKGKNEFKGEKAGEFFSRVHDEEVWKNCRSIINELYPDFVVDFDWFAEQREGYICNMFVCDKSLFDEYCSWLFPVLFQLHETIDYTKYNNYNRRMIGFVGERLFNVWIHHKNLKVKELPIYVTETENQIKARRKLQRLVFEMKKILSLVD